MKILKYAYVSSVQIPPFKIIHFSSREVSRSQHNWEEARVPRGPAPHPPEGHRGGGWCRPWSSPAEGHPGPHHSGRPCLMQSGCEDAGLSVAVSSRWWPWQPHTACAFLLLFSPFHSQVPCAESLLCLHGPAFSRMSAIKVLWSGTGQAGFPHLSPHWNFAHGFPQLGTHLLLELNDVPPAWMDHSSFLHSVIEGHLGPFHARVLYQHPGLGCGPAPSTCFPLKSTAECETDLLGVPNLAP